MTESGGDVAQYLALRRQRRDAIVAARAAMGVFLNRWLNGVTVGERGDCPSGARRAAAGLAAVLVVREVTR